MKYLKIPTQFLKKIKELDDAEAGRLFSAMLFYSATGTEPELPGCERFFWSDVKKEIDRQVKRYEKQVSSAATARKHNPNNARNRICFKPEYNELTGDVNTSSAAELSPESTELSPESTESSSLSTESSSETTELSSLSTELSPESTEFSSREGLARGNDYQVINNHLVDTKCTECTDLAEISDTEKKKVKKSKVLSDDNTRQTLQNQVDIIITAWNGLGLSQVTKISDSSSRGKMLRARISEYGLDSVLKAIENVRHSRFLKGQSRSGWTISFDWFVHPENFLKVLEGNYTDPAARAHSPPVNDDFDPEEIDRIRITK